MSTWQSDLLDSLARTLPRAEIVPYGSATDPELLDGWSDLDVTITSATGVDLEAALGGRLWAVQSTREDHSHLVRAVLLDGRRVDARILGATAEIPEPADDNDVRFEAALAASRFGRGSDLIGLHLTLGILREALVQRMVAADQVTGSTHHRHATAYDADAAAAQAVLAGMLGPQTALRAYALYGSWRSAANPGYSPDARGLEAVIARGRDASRAP